VFRRTWILFRARLTMAGRAGWPIPALLFQALLATVLALLVRDALPPFPYALFVLSLSALLLAVPLLSELGLVLRRDEGGEWAESLPARPIELALARLLQLVLLLLLLALAFLVPAALLAPAGFGLVPRLLLPGLGCGLALVLAAVLIWFQRLLQGRAESLLVLLQTALVVGTVVGLLTVLGHVPELARLTPQEGASSWLAFFPPSWFAAPLAGGGASEWSTPLAVSALALLSLFFARTPRARAELRRRSLLALLLVPLRGIAARFWVRSDERGAFDLVFDALPREREVVLRTYPMFGIPLAFLWIGAREAQGRSGPWQDDLLSLLFFTVVIYLPLFLTHVPLSESSGAAWLLGTAPVTRAGIVAGAIKALFVRFLLPLYLVLALLALGLSGPELLARLWLPALLSSLFLLRLLYPRCVRELPLSVPPEELHAEPDWTGLLTGLAAGLTLVAVLANRFLTWPLGLLAALVLAALDSFLARRMRARPA